MAFTLSASSARRALAAPLRAVIAAVLKHEHRKSGDIGLRLADDAELRVLNRQWRRIDRATDVISFAYDEHEPDAATRPVTGDLAVSLDRVFAQARRFRVTPGEELARLIVHGTLHLAGHDHVQAGERRRMRDREDAILARVRASARRMDVVLRRIAATERGNRP